jgi:hypothetical protein
MRAIGTNPGRGNPGVHATACAFGGAVDRFSILAQSSANGLPRKQRKTRQSRPKDLIRRVLFGCGAKFEPATSRL